MTPQMEKAPTMGKIVRASDKKRMTRPSYTGPARMSTPRAVSAG